MLSKHDLRTQGIRKYLRRGVPCITEEHKRLWLNLFCERDDEGWIVYKNFGAFYESPGMWFEERCRHGWVETAEMLARNLTLKPIIREPHVDLVEAHTCGRGVNVGICSWTFSDYGIGLCKARIRFEWLKDVVIPRETDGKIRVKQLEIIEVFGEHWVLEESVRRLYRKLKRKGLIK